MCNIKSNYIEDTVNQHNQRYQNIYSNLMDGIDMLETISPETDKRQIIEDRAAIERAWDRMLSVYRRNIRPYVEANHG